LTLHVYFLKIWLITVPCIVEFTGHLLSDENDTTGSTGMKAEGMGIADANGKGTEIRLGQIWDREWE